MKSTAEVSGLSAFWIWFIIVACCLVVVITGAAVWIVHLVETAFARIFGEMVELGIEAVADEVLGIDVNFGAVEVGVLRGFVLINDLKIANPPNWKSDCFLNAHKIEVKLNLWRYVWT